MMFQVKYRFFALYDPLLANTTCWRIHALSCSWDEQIQDYGIFSLTAMPEEAVIPELVGVLSQDFCVNTNMHHSFVEVNDMSGTIYGPLRFVNHSCKPNAQVWTKLPLILVPV